MTRIVIHGAGRMARRVLAQLPGFKGFEVVGLVSRSEPGDDPGVDWFASLEQLDVAVDLLIDFTLPGGTRVAADWCAGRNVALLSGTTGLMEEDINALERAAVKVPVLWASNMSPGVALVAALVRQAAAVLGSGAAVSITDIHHRHKLDAPSGTALSLAGAVKQGCEEYLRSTPEAGHSRVLDSEPVFSSERTGEIIGEHTVGFSMPGETIEITHKALNRDVFAKGALKAAQWLVRQSPGYYSTGDWLGLR